jgi:diguanylate cyclase (GGDEF)-like protein
MAGISPISAISPKALPSGVVFLASLMVMALLAGADIYDGPEIWLNPLYSVPVVAVAFFCTQRKQVIFTVVLSVALQITVFHTYPMARISEIVDSFVALTTASMVAYFVRMARTSYLAVDTLATTDALTGLKNRRSFECIVDAEIARQKRYSGFFSLAIIDLDGFKHLNDSLGHRAGDRALQALAGILRQYSRQSDTIARVGGDEFAVLMPNTMAADCRMVCGELSAKISAQMAEAGFEISASIGYSVFEQAPESTSEALHKVDLAMYTAKTKGNGCVVDAYWMPAEGHTTVDLRQPPVHPEELRK